jgi:hypothetical protein
MKNYFNAFVLMYNLGFSQSAPVTFEAGEIGSAWSFTNFDNGTVSSVGYEKVANPSVSGINTSATVEVYSGSHWSCTSRMSI